MVGSKRSDQEPPNATPPTTGEGLSRSAFVGSAVMLFAPAVAVSASTAEAADTPNPELEEHDASPSAHPPLRARLNAVESGSASIWTPNTAYAAGQRAANSGHVYAATTAFTSGASFDPTDWNLLGTAAFWQWSKQSSLRLDDFAPGNGIDDAGPGAQAAIDALVVEGKTELIVGKGTFKISSSVARNITSGPSSVHFKGDGAASRILIARGAGGYAFDFAISNCLLFEGITFLGTMGVATDAARAINVTGPGRAIFRNCGFFGLSSAAVDGAVIRTDHLRLLLKECEFRGCTGAQGVTPVIKSSRFDSLICEDTMFIDFGSTYGDSYSKTSMNSAKAWIEIGNPGSVLTEHNVFEVRRSQFDEGALNAIRCSATGVGDNGPRNVPTVVLDDVVIFGWGGTGSYPLDFSYVDHVYLRKLRVRNHLLTGVERNAMRFNHCRKVLLEEVRCEHRHRIIAFTGAAPDIVTFRDVTYGSVIGNATVRHEGHAPVLMTFDGDVAALPPGRGLLVTNPAGTLTKRVRLNDAGTALVIEDELPPPPPASAYRIAVMADDPLLYWRLGEAAGTIAQDQTANNRDGTYMGAVTLGRAGALRDDANTAVEFAVPTGAKILSTYDPFSGARTFEGWSLRTDTSGYHAFMSSANTAVQFRTAIGSQSVLFVPSNEAGTYGLWSAAIPTAEWFHWILTFDDAADVTELWINGVSKGSRSCTRSWAATTGDLVIGTHGSSGYANPFKGRMDEIAVYRTILSAARIQAHYSAGNTG